MWRKARQLGVVIGFVSACLATGDLLWRGSTGKLRLRQKIVLAGMRIAAYGEENVAAARSGNVGWSKNAGVRNGNPFKKATQYVGVISPWRNRRHDIKHIAKRRGMAAEAMSCSLQALALARRAAALSWPLIGEMRQQKKYNLSVRRRPLNRQQ